MLKRVGSFKSYKAVCILSIHKKLVYENYFEMMLPMKESQ
jgi:hypothetical protein